MSFNVSVDNFRNCFIGCLWLHPSAKLNKVSVGKTAPMENRAREEFPLFLTLLARKSFS